MIVNQHFSQMNSTEQTGSPLPTQELPLSAENTLFPLHKLDAFLNFLFQLVVIFILSASVFPAMRWLEAQVQQHYHTQIQNIR